MKTGIATALSVAGVLAAGAGAFAVNNSVLGTKNVDAIVSPSTIRAEGTLDSATTTVPTGSVSANATQVGTNTTTYQVGAAGSVVVDTSSGAIVVTGIAPSAGFTSEAAVTQPDGSVKVHFVAPGRRIEFVARLVGGQVKVDVSNETTKAAPPAGSEPRRHHDDDEGDEHEHEFGGFGEDD